MTRAYSLVSSLALSVGLLSAGCGEEDTNQQPDSTMQESVTNQESVEIDEGACTAIIDACHEKDDQSGGDVSICHSAAHNKEHETCTVTKDDCIALCDAAPVFEGNEDAHDDTAHDDDDHDDMTHTGGDDDDTGGHDDEDVDGDDVDGAAICQNLMDTCHSVESDKATECHDIGHDEVAEDCIAAEEECLAECS